MYPMALIRNRTWQPQCIRLESRNNSTHLTDASWALNKMVCQLPNAAFTIQEITSVTHFNNNQLRREASEVWQWNSLSFPLPPGKRQFSNGKKGIRVVISLLYPPSWRDAGHSPCCEVERLRLWNKTETRSPGFHLTPLRPQVELISRPSFHALLF